MELPPVHTLNLRGVFSMSKIIILGPSYWHFITLSPFFLPLSCFFIIISTFDYSNHEKLLSSYIIYTLIIYLFTLCAICTVTYITHHAFFGSPINSSDALKSLTSSFFRVALTTIIAHVLIVFISLAFLLLMGALLMLLHNLGFAINHNSIYFVMFSGIACAILIAIIVYVNVEWSLAFVVVVVESKWGFAALMRSAYLVKGMRSVSLYFWNGVAGMVWMCYTSRHVLLVTMLSSFFSIMFLVRITVANTVLYNYCKALHGELVIEVADDGFDQEYMSLPADDDKVPHVVTAVTGFRVLATGVRAM